MGIWCRRSKGGAGLVSVLLAINGSAALAVIEPPDEPETTHKGAQDQKAPDGGLLAGPEVEKESVDQTPDDMGPAGGEGGPRRRANRVQFQQWLEALRGLELTDDQQKAIRAIAAKFQDEQREFQEKHGRELRALSAKMRAARERGTLPDEKTRQALQRLESQRPRPDGHQTRIWNELTEEQQAEMKVRLDEMEQRMAERRGRAERDADVFRPSGEDEMQQSPPAASGSSDKAMMKAEDETAAPPPRAPRERRRGAAIGRPDMSQLDEVGRKRVEFLLSRQAAQRGAREPSPEERKFEFADD